MKRFAFLAPLAFATAAVAQGPPVEVQVQAQPVPIEQVEVQLQVQPAIDIVPGGDPNLPPGTKPKLQEEFKPAAGTSADPKSLLVPENILLKAKDLVRQLGSPAYRERESATRELTKMGRVCYTPLKEAITTEMDPEIRLRAELLMPRVEAAEMEARVSCFMLDVEGKYEHELPGWAKFRNTAGNDTSARALFGEVLKNKAYHTLLLASELPANELGGLLGAHYRDMQTQQNMRRGGVNMQPKIQEIAVLIFLESLYSDKELAVNYQWGYAVSNYMYQAEIQSAMVGKGAGKYAAPLRKLVNQWLETRETGTGAQMAMQFAQNWNLPNITKYAGKVLAAPTEQGNWWVKQNALVVIGQKGGDKETIKQISKVFEDTTPIQVAQPNQPNMPTIQLQDFALGVALRLTKQDPKTYGMDLLSTSPSSHWQHNNYMFKDDKTAKAEDKRKAAFKQWADWETKQKDEPKKEEEKKDPPK